MATIYYLGQTITTDDPTAGLVLGTAQGHANLGSCGVVTVSPGDGTSAPVSLVVGAGIALMVRYDGDVPVTFIQDAEDRVRQRRGAAG